MTKHIINDSEYIFFNESWSVGMRWGHKTTLHENGVEITEARARYYNRTWEAYQYQSVMKNAVYKLINELLFYAIVKYKFENNIKRLTQEKKEIVKTQLKKDNADLYELRDKL